MSKIAHLFPATTQYQALITQPQPPLPVPRMPTAKRAMQFGAFAAVAGEQAIKTTYSPQKNA